MPTTRSCCFTGYRPEKFPFPFHNGHMLYTDFEDRLTGAIFTLVADGYTRFYTGAARGFDLLAAEVTLLCRRMRRMPIELYCAVPFPEQTEGWPDEWKKRYQAVLDEADKVVCLADHYFRGCYQRRNQYMVDNSQAVLTYFDGQKGGTASTLAYARQKGKPVVNLTDCDLDACLEDIPLQFEIVL